MRTRAGAVVGVVGMLAAMVGHAAGAAPTNAADDRFDAITGPMGAFVVRPTDFGIDANRTLVAVPPLLASVDGDRAFGVIEQLNFPRTSSGPESARQDARNIVTAELEDAGYAVERQSVELNGVDSPNLYADLPGTECAERIVVIGGHYDNANPEGGGSDDNASGVAGMLELARALQDQPLPVTVRFASWSYEEDGLVGAFAMAQELKAEGAQVVGAISLEMIGYTEPEIDPLTGLPATYLAMISDPTSAALAQVWGAATYTYTPSFPAFGAVISPEVLPDILRSDHAAFLANGFPAMMATDTANFRNENYHQPTDTPDTIDQDFLKGSITAALAGLATFGSIDQDQDGRADVCGPGITPVTSTTSSTVAPVPTTSPSATAPDAVAADPVTGRADYTG